MLILKKIKKKSDENVRIVQDFVKKVIFVAFGNIRFNEKIANFTAPCSDFFHWINGIGRNIYLFSSESAKCGGGNRNRIRLFCFYNFNFHLRLDDIEKTVDQLND